MTAVSGFASLQQVGELFGGAVSGEHVLSQQVAVGLGVVAAAFVQMVPAQRPNGSTASPSRPKRDGRLDGVHAQPGGAGRFLRLVLGRAIAEMDQSSSSPSGASAAASSGSAWWVNQATPAPLYSRLDCARQLAQGGGVV